MYVLIHKNRVIVGPMAWNRAMFDGALRKLNIQVTLPRVAPAQLPLILDDQTRIAESKYDYPVYNEKIEYLNGPFWNFDAPVAVGNWQIMPIAIEFIKGNLKAQAADVRYQKEVAGTSCVIQGQTVSLDTSRAGREIFAQAYLLMGDSDQRNWKFPEGWLTLTKTDLGTCVAAGVQHIQSCFDWEKAKGVEIDACETAAQLDQIIVDDRVQPVNPDQV